MTVVEADNKAIIVTGETALEVYEATQTITRRCGEIFTTWTFPLLQADGNYVSRGRIILGEAS